MGHKLYMQRTTRQLIAERKRLRISYVVGLGLLLQPYVRVPTALPYSSMFELRTIFELLSSNSI